MHLLTSVLPQSSLSDPISASAKHSLQHSGVPLGAGALEVADGMDDELLEIGPTGWLEDDDGTCDELLGAWQKLLYHSQ